MVERLRPPPPPDALSDDRAIVFDSDSALITYLRGERGVVARTPGAGRFLRAASNRGVKLFFVSRYYITTGALAAIAQNLGLDDAFNPMPAGAGWDDWEKFRNVRPEVRERVADSAVSTALTHLRIADLPTELFHIVPAITVGRIESGVIPVKEARKNALEVILAKHGLKKGNVLVVASAVPMIEAAGELDLACCKVSELKWDGRSRCSAKPGMPLDLREYREISEFVGRVPQGIRARRRKVCN